MNDETEKYWEKYDEMERMEINREIDLEFKKEMEKEEIERKIKLDLISILKPKIQLMEYKKIPECQIKLKKDGK